MRQHTTITLPRVRHAQLKAIAERNGSTVPQLLDAWIRHELQRLGMADDPPPGYYAFPMTVEGECVVHFGHNDLKTTVLSLTEAREFADAINACASTEKPGLFEIEAGFDTEIETEIKTKRGGRHVEVRKQGRGVSIHIDDSSHGMTPAIAIEVARAVLRAADEAELLPSEVMPEPEMHVSGRRKA